jgi:hypothetical protein
VSQDNLVEYRMDIYSQMLDRKSASLSKAPELLKGVIWLCSSPTEEHDVISERISQVEANNIPNIKVFDNISRWVARNEPSDNTFDFYYGSDTKDPQVLTDDLDRSLFEKDRIESIPSRYLNEFNIDTVAAIRDIAGRRTSAESAFFSSVSIFEKVFYKENKIFSKDDLTISFKDKDFSVEDFLIDKEYFRNPLDKHCYRYIHIDIGSRKDRFGLSSSYSNVIKFRSDEGIETSRRMYFVDFCLGISAKKGDEVDIIKVLNFLSRLKKDFKYPIKKITTDSHQGILARQIIKTYGIPAEYLSMETDKSPYQNLKNLILTESLIGYKNSILTRELKDLRDYGKKIAKRRGNNASDDLCESLAGSLYSCMLDKNFYTSEKALNNVIDIHRNLSTSSFEGILGSLADIDVFDDIPIDLL